MVEAGAEIGGEELRGRRGATRGEGAQRVLAWWRDEPKGGSALTRRTFRTHSKTSNLTR